MRLSSQVRVYGRSDLVQITELGCLWYGSFRSRTVLVGLVCDDKPEKPGAVLATGSPPAHDQPKLRNTRGVEHPAAMVQGQTFRHLGAMY